jgi:hypothetical protein
MEKTNDESIVLIGYGETRKKLKNIQRKETQKKYSLNDIFNLIQDEKTFEIYYKDIRVTNEVSLKAIKKYWTEEEINTLKENFGKVVIDELRREFLPNKSVGQIRHKSSELSLTVDRKWQDYEITGITAMKKSGMSYLQISRILQRPKGACETKAHKLGITHTGNHSEDYEGIDETLERYSKIPSITKGKIAEDLSVVKLLQNEIDIFIPYTPNHQTDLIAVKGSKIAKLQVKSCIWDQKHDRFRVPITRKNARTHERFFYSILSWYRCYLYCSI